MLQPSECALHSAISMRFQISRTSSEIWAKDRPASGQAELLPKREITRHTPHNATTHRHYLCWTWSWRASQTHANSLPMTLRLWGTTARRSVQQHIVASASMVANHTASGSSCGMLCGEMHFPKCKYRVWPLQWAQLSFHLPHLSGIPAKCCQDRAELSTLDKFRLSGEKANLE